MFIRPKERYFKPTTLNSPTTKEQELLRNTFALFKEDSIQCLLDHLRGSERIVSDENVGWFEDGFSEPFRQYFIPNRVVCIVHIQSTISKKCENMVVKILSEIIVARSHNIIPPELAPSFSEFVYQFVSSPVGLRLMRRTQQEHNVKWFLMEFLVDSCQPSQTPSEFVQIVLTRPTPLLISAIDVINTRFSIHNLSRYLSTPPDLTNEKDEDSSARTDLAFDVLFLSLLSIVSDEEVHKPARHLLARMFEMSEGELERLLLEREVRRGDLEMEWLGEGRTKEDTLSFAEGVWMLLGRRETEEERDEDTTESEPESEEMHQVTDSVESPGTIRIIPNDETTSTPTVFLHRVACLFISALFSAASVCLSSNHQPTASTDTNHNDPDSTDDSASESNTHKMSESHLFRICLKLTFWLQTTFEKWWSGSVFTKTVRMDVESAVSLVFLLLPHADLDSQCFLVFQLRHFSRFIEMVPRVITPDLVRKVVLFFARLSPSLPHELVRCVEYGVRSMLEGGWQPQYGCDSEEAAELCRPILADLLNRLESVVEGRREIAAQIWVIMSSNDYHLLYDVKPLVPLLSVLSDTTDVDEAFFILRAITKHLTHKTPGERTLSSLLLQPSSALYRFGNRMDRPQVVIEAWRIVYHLLAILNRSFRYRKGDPTEFVEMTRQIVMEFVQTVERALKMRGHTDQSFGREADINHLFHFLGTFLIHLHAIFNIDLSPLILSLIPAITPTQQFFFGNSENSLWHVTIGLSHHSRPFFIPLAPIHFIPTLPSFPTEKSVFDDVLNRKLARVESILRFGRHHTNTSQRRMKSIRLRLFKSVNRTLRVKMASECAIRLPRLLHKTKHFLREIQAQTEQGGDPNWLKELFYRMEMIFSKLNLGLLTTLHIREIRPSDTIDTGLVRWALIDGNRRDALPPTNEEDSSPSETGLSFVENLQFAAMWMLNGMVEFPFSSPTRRYDSGIPLLWKMMLNSILFKSPFDPSIAQTAVQLRVCLWEEGVEDVVDAVGHLIHKSFWAAFPLNPHLPAVKEGDVDDGDLITSAVCEDLFVDDDDDLINDALQPALDDSLEAKTINFLESVVSDDEESDGDSLGSYASFSDDSSTDFVQCIVILISSSSQDITTATMKMLGHLIWSCSAKIHLALAKADLSPQLITNLNPLSLSFTETDDIPTGLLRIISNSLRLATPYSLRQLGIEDDKGQQAVHETVFQQVLAPSEKYICHLCVNRYSIMDRRKSDYLMDILTYLLELSPSYQPTMDFVLKIPIFLTIPSCLTFFEIDYAIFNFLSSMVNIQRGWNEKRGEKRQNWKTVYRMMRMEGIEDVIEVKLRNDNTGDFGGWVVKQSIEWNTLQGMNLPKQE
ncbi:hypothetical protein BLNAU_12458 [Blattamonas nauphoetae]|uniref:Uncharacterized protein n=1 Tax=Blattamonas nauphoetae TaxID=2049346 RepID=A0ABQ9XR25_9EUKA|nr:hypothetical protein BLNAU_12458 [Blattamonas nauphoetae]